MRKPLAMLFAASAIVVAVMAVSVEARADFESGNSLYAECTEEGHFFRQGHCMGYIVGVHDLIEHLGDRVGFPACFPQHVTQGQAQDVVLQFLRQHPEIRHYSAAYLVARALSEAFPCSK